MKHKSVNLCKSVNPTYNVKHMKGSYKATFTYLSYCPNFLITASP
jgi:hypothetical protein